jgi:hypothetical protein
MAQYGTPDVGILGMPCAFDNTIESYIASGNVTPGRPVYVTPGAPNVCHEAFTAGDLFAGIAMLSHKGYVDGVGYYADKENVNVLSKGRIYVQTNENVTTAPVAVYASVTAGATFGKFVLSATAAANFGAIARGNAAAQGIIEVQVDGPRAVAVA